MDELDRILLALQDSGAAANSVSKKEMLNNGSKQSHSNLGRESSFDALSKIKSKFQSNDGLQSSMESLEEGAMNRKGSSLRNPFPGSANYKSANQLLQTLDLLNVAKKNRIESTTAIDDTPVIVTESPAISRNNSAAARITTLTRNHSKARVGPDTVSSTANFNRPKAASYECAGLLTLILVCKTLIKSGGSMFGGKAYHSDHFICSEATCGKYLAGVIVFEKNNALYCERDYHKKFSPQCAYCKEPIKDNPIEAVGKHFHSDHFFCSQCGIENLMIGKTFDKNDLYMQVNVFCNLSTKGKRTVRKTITYYLPEDGTVNLKSSDGCHKGLVNEYITALDKNWHPECFICSVALN